MKEQVLVSIIVPVYNSGLYLSDCLNSISHQTYKTYELILINDGSTDNSVEIIKNFIRGNSHVRVVLIDLAQNVGQSAARNKGIQNALGKYLLFVDSDDTISSDCLERMVGLAEREQLNMVIGENVIIGENVRYVEVGFNDEIIRDNVTILRLFTEFRWYNPAWNKLVRTDVIKQNNLYFKEGYIFEDELWSFLLAINLQSMGVIRAPLYNYYIRSNSTMANNQNLKRWLGLQKILPDFKVYITNANLLTNLFVSRFFLLKLVTVINGLEANNYISAKNFKYLRKLNYVNLFFLYKKGFLTIRELIAYLYLNLPEWISYAYYKMIRFYINIK